MMMMISRMLGRMLAEGLAPSGGEISPFRDVSEAKHMGMR
jgi:hypothetical protein